MTKFLSLLAVATLMIIGTSNAQTTLAVPTDVYKNPICTVKPAAGDSAWAIAVQVAGLKECQNYTNSLKSVFGSPLAAYTEEGTLKAVITCRDRLGKSMNCSTKTMNGNITSP